MEGVDKITWRRIIYDQYKVFNNFEQYSLDVDDPDCILPHATHTCLIPKCLNNAVEEFIKDKMVSQYKSYCLIYDVESNSDTNDDFREKRKKMYEKHRRSLWQPLGMEPRWKDVADEVSYVETDDEYKDQNQKMRPTAELY